jgi:hypothetical protein
MSVERDGFSPWETLKMLRTLLVILLWLAMWVLPCVVAPRIDLEDRDDWNEG